MSDENKKCDFCGNTEADQEMRFRNKDNGKIICKDCILKCKELIKVNSDKIIYFKERR